MESNPNPTDLSPEVVRILERAHKRSRKSGTPVPVSVRLEGPLCEALEWLARREIHPRIYWSNRDGSIEFAAAGELLAVELADPDPFSRTLSKIEGIWSRFHDLADVPFLGGFAFNPAAEPDPLWEGFPTAWFVLPKVLFRRLKKKKELLIQTLVRPTDDLDDLKRQVGKTAEENRSSVNFSMYRPLPRLQTRFDRPPFGEWRKIVNSALDDIEKERVQKVVLARRTDLRLDRVVDALHLLRTLRREGTGCYQFCFERGQGYAFLGLTPERLLQIRKSTLESEAISGTEMRGGSEFADQECERKLLAGDKLRREHQFVVDNVMHALNQHCRSTGSQPLPGILKLRHIQHLMTPIRGELKSDTTRHQVIESLHPTAAVGGTPRAEALSTIRNLEPFGRGWYAGSVGWLTRDVIELAVGIRSMLVHDTTLSVFAGAGIVEGSRPDAEWSEIERKIMGVSRLFPEAT